MGKTVTTYLKDSDPHGAQYLVISNKVCKLMIIPRSNLSVLKEWNELQTPSFYMLIGGDDASMPEAYIGETESFKERVKDHDNKKDFWQKALVFVSTDKNMTKADVQYLECKAIQQAKEAKRFVLNSNKQTPKLPHLAEHRKDDMEEFFEDIKFLTSFINCNIFTIIKRSEKHLFYIKERGCSACGFYDSAGFTLLKDSIISKDVRPSYAGKEKRDKFIKEFTSEVDGCVQVVLDKIFSSPSAAASFCIGGERNGWKAWKDKDGQTLDDVYRRAIED